MDTKQKKGYHDSARGRDEGERTLIFIFWIKWIEKRSPLKRQSGHISSIQELHLCTLSVQRSPFWIVELVGHPFRFIKHVPFFCVCVPLLTIIIT